MHVHNSLKPQDKRLVVGVTGHIGAGKTSVARYLSEAHRFSYVRYSQVLSEWKSESPDSKKRLQSIGWDVMGGGMQAELNERLIARIPSRANCAVDGLRHPTDYDCLSRAFSSRFYLLYIDCAQETRWERLRPRYPLLEDFRQADLHPVEQQIEALRGKAFALINNSGSLEALYSEVEERLQQMHRGGQL